MPSRPESPTTTAAREWVWREKPGREPLPREHGTQRGYDQHRYRREQPCGPCKYAHQLYNTGRAA